MEIRKLLNHGHIHFTKVGNTHTVLVRLQQANEIGCFSLPNASVQSLRLWAAVEVLRAFGAEWPIRIVHISAKNPNASAISAITAAPVDSAVIEATLDAVRTPLPALSKWTALRSFDHKLIKRHTTGDPIARYPLLDLTSYLQYTRAPFSLFDAALLSAYGSLIGASTLRSLIDTRARRHASELDQLAEGMSTSIAVWHVDTRAWETYGPAARRQIALVKSGPARYHPLIPRLIAPVLTRSASPTASSDSSLSSSATSSANSVALPTLFYGIPAGQLPFISKEPGPLLFARRRRKVPQISRPSSSLAEHPRKRVRFRAASPTPPPPLALPESAFNWNRLQVSSEKVHNVRPGPLHLSTSLCLPPQFFVTSEVTGDGNCGPRALALALLGDQNLHADIRNDIADSIDPSDDSDREWLENVFQAEGQPPLCADQALERLRRNRESVPIEWFAFAARRFDLPLALFVINQDGSVQQHIFGAQEGEPIRFAFVHFSMHFELIVRLY